MLKFIKTLIFLFIIYLKAFNLQLKGTLVQFNAVKKFPGPSPHPNL